MMPTEQPSRVVARAVLDLVSSEREIAQRLLEQHWNVVQDVAGYDPETAEMTLQQLDRGITKPQELSQLVRRYALARRAAGLPVGPVSAA